jgi:hypothetical protein
MKPPSVTLSNNLLKASMTRRKNKGDRGSPCLNPRELLKNPVGLPLTSTEKRTEEMQAKTHLRQVSLKLQRLTNYIVKKL